jgi:transcriptional regulator with XRE-family HTH domain
MTASISPSCGPAFKRHHRGMRTLPPGSRLREIRESRGMTQTAVARQAGLSRSFYAQVEHARQAISVDRAFAIANVLGVQMTELFTAFPAVPHARPC